MSKKTKKKAMAAVKQILLILMTLVMFFPLYIVFIMSTYYSEDIFKGMPVLPGSYFLENFKVVVSKGYFQAYINSIAVSAASVIISVTVSSLIGFALAKYDFKGKTIMPFCSHGGGRFGQSLTAIAKLAPDADIGEGLAINYSVGTSIPSDVRAWLETNHVDKK